MSLFSMGVFSSMPAQFIMPWIRSPPKRRMISSSSATKKRDWPGSPWRPARPRSWLSMRRASCLSVPMTYSPPSDTTLSCLFCHSARTFSSLSSGGLPPRMISTPRPAMLVATVTAPGSPAWATILASCSCFLAFSMLCFTPRRFSRSLRHFAFLDGDGTDEHRLPAVVSPLHFVGDSLELGCLILVNQVAQVFPREGFIGGYLHYVEFIDFRKFLRFGSRGTGHARPAWSTCGNSSGW